jgi:hypothetical protein
MKKNIFGFVFFSILSINAQEVVKEIEKVTTAIEDTTRVEGWTKKGQIIFLFNQSSFSNWIAGGENTFSGNLGLNYDLNYKRNNLSWDSKIMASYGLLQTQNAEFEKKTDDRLEINSIGGKRAWGLWYYSIFVNFRTQFARGYTYATDVNGNETREAFTDFMSPGYLTVGPGLLWRKRNDFKFNLAPLTSKMTFVDARFTSIPGYVNGSYFGVDAYQNFRYELGFYAAGFYKFNLFENVTAENILNLYSNYLEDPQNVDLDYQLNIVMTINKFLTTNFSFHTIYDDNAFRGFQVRQVFGLAVKYGF